MFLHTNNQLFEKEIKRTIPLTIASKPKKYLRIHLTKEMNDLYNENGKALTKELKKTEIKRKCKGFN